MTARSEIPSYFDFCSFCDRRRDPEERFPNGPTASICGPCLTQCEVALRDQKVTAEVLDAPRCGFCSPENQGTVFVLRQSVSICDSCVGRCRVLLNRLTRSKGRALADTTHLALRVVKLSVPDSNVPPSS
jgi:ATP-dependent protease Clp ATPase subunit